jgi:TPR repeat protein
MGKRGKRGDKLAAKKAILKRLDALAKQVEEELKGADLFGPPPPMDDCGVCLVPSPRTGNKVFYQGCCGKSICKGCFKENRLVIEKMNQALTCPFCRVPWPSDTEYVRQLEVRASKGDCTACGMLGNAFDKGFLGVNKNEMKALHYYILAVEFGSGLVCGSIGKILEEGEGVPVDTGKAALFYRAGALRGDVVSRHMLGDLEYDHFGNHELAIRHWKIAAAAGCQPSLTRLRNIYNANGKKPGKEFIAKDELDSIYRMGHEAQQDIKSEEREKHIEGEDIFKC